MALLSKSLPVSSVPMRLCKHLHFNSEPMTFAPKKTATWLFKVTNFASVLFKLLFASLQDLDTEISRVYF